MKILFSLTYYLPYLSGLTIYVARLAEGLSKKGYRVEVLASQHEKDLPSKEKIGGIKVVRVPYIIKINKGFVMPAYLWQSFLSVRRVDRVIINLPQFEGFIVAFLAKLLGKKLLCIYHCEVELSTGLGNKLVGLLLHGANLLSLFMADRIITYTEDYARHSRFLPRFWPKLEFIYPPIPQPEVDQKLQKRLGKLTPGKKCFVIGVAARLAAEKGIEYLLETIPLLEETLDKDFIILFAAPLPVGEEKYLQKLTPLLKKYQHYLRFAGVIPYQKMGSFYKFLDLLVLPSVNSTESFGMVQVEAMMMGVPVVATDLPGVRVPIQKTGMGIIVPPKKPEELAKAIAKIFNNKHFYTPGVSKIGKIFNPEETIHAYNQLLRGQGG